jgi:hypothetical protein
MYKILILDYFLFMSETETERETLDIYLVVERLSLILFLSLGFSLVRMSALHELCVSYTQDIATIISSLIW